MDDDEYQYARAIKADHRKRWIAAGLGTAGLIAWFVMKMEKHHAEEERAATRAQMADLESELIRYRIAQAEHLRRGDGAPDDEELAAPDARAAIAALTAADAAWHPAIVAFDPAGVRAAPPCARLEAAQRGMPAWRVDASAGARVAWPTEMVVSSPVPITIVHAGEAVPTASPEAAARIAAIRARVAAGVALPADAAAPLATVDVLLVLDAAPASPSGSALPAGTPIARAYVFDHAADRLVCGGDVPLPPATAEDHGTRVDEDRLRALLATLPAALRALE